MLPYGDCVASRRALSFIEERVLSMVLPMYANAHTESSATGVWTGSLRKQAQDKISQACGGIPFDHVVLFTGSGATGAIDTFKRYLMRDADNSMCSENAAVIVGSHEHHSNILPWRESGTKVLRCKQSIPGNVDLDHAKKLLKKYHNRQLLLGTSSSASNVDGTLTDSQPLVELFHRFGAYIAFDYAAAALYVDVNIAQSGADAIFISTHKFAGGPGTPGVLVCKRSINSRNATPHRLAGGIVLLVTDDTHVYVNNLAVREVGGTPDIVGAIRAGLVFQVKQDIGALIIHRIETSFLQQSLKRLCSLSGLVILGSSETTRLANLSFLVKHSDKFLHHSFVTQVLNDLFGIQSRKGCACASPYSLRLLGLNHSASKIVGGVNHNDRR